MFKKILFLTVIFFGLSQLYCYANDNIKFLTLNDKEIYTNIVNKAHNQKEHGLIDKVDFENVDASQSIINKKIKTPTILYINSDEINNILVQAPNGFIGSMRRINMYSGIGLTKTGYNNYSQIFENLKVTYDDPSGDFIVIKPEILNFSYRFEERGKIRYEEHMFVNLTMFITVYKNNKEIFHKIYKENNIETYGYKGSINNTIFSDLVSKAMRNTYQKNIQDLVKLF